MEKKANYNRLLPRITPLATLLLLASFIPSLPAAAINDNEYQFCATYLLKAGVNPESGGVACAQALHPMELTECVFTIKKQTTITAPQALSACVQVRRPLELATCTIGINHNIKSADSQAVLDNCRRSLLPVRFSECVVGLSNKIKLSPVKAMETCISTDESSPNLYPKSVSPLRQTLPLTIVPNSSSNNLDNQSLRN